MIVNAVMPSPASEPRGVPAPGAALRPSSPLRESLAHALSLVTAGLCGRAPDAGVAPPSAQRRLAPVTVLDRAPAPLFRDRSALHAAAAVAVSMVLAVGAGTIVAAVTSGGGAGAPMAAALAADQNASRISAR